MLQGLKVVEYASYIAAPGAGGILADWGADVVKVEPLAGDPIRGFFESIGSEASGNPVFELDNRGKRSLALDTSTAEGMGVLKRLIAKADVFLTNVRPAALARASLYYQNLNAFNARLVYAVITGYGLAGTEADKPGMDVAAFWSRAGVGRLTTPKDAEIIPCRTGMGDHMTSLSAVAGIMGALYARGRDGKGRMVETSLLRNGIYAIGSDMAIQLRLGRIASTKARTQSPNPIGNFFKTADGHWICLLPRQGNKDWAEMCAAMERPDLVADPRFSSPKARRENREAVVAELDRVFVSRPLADWAFALDSRDIIWAPVQTPAEVAADPQAAACGAFVDVPDGEGGARRAPATPVSFPSSPLGFLRKSPELGEHTREVLSECGYSSSDIEALAAAGAITAGA
ncbi:MAG: CaiB/BaiF CoA-transferase family protein [Alphaproteobacteria bacterium]